MNFYEYLEQALAIINMTPILLLLIVFSLHTRKTAVDQKSRLYITPWCIRNKFWWEN